MSLEDVRAVFHQVLAKDDVWYPIAWPWWTRWCEHVGFALNDNPLADKDGPADGPEPGPIQNEELAAEGAAGDRKELMPGIQEGRHFIWVNDKVWKLLQDKYSGGPAFPRKVVSRGLMQSTSIEAYPLFCSLAIADEEKDGEPKKEEKYVISKLSTLEELVAQLPDEDRPAEDAEIRIWMLEQKKPPSTDATENGEGEKADGSPGKGHAAESAMYWQLKFDKAGMGVKIEDLGEMPDFPHFLLDVKKKDGMWSRNVGPKKDWRDFAVGDVIDALDTAHKWYESTVRDVKPDKILVHYEGWEPRWDAWIPRDSPNLAPKNTYTTGPYKSHGDRSGYYGGGSEKGNPMERGACLSNTPGLTDFFVENKHKAQVNRENPLGWQGRVAMEYGNLLSEIWSGQYTVVYPTKFKQVMGEIQPRFSGYQQHDSSELLSFLLDGLHEDLNRVKKKPFTQAVDSKGRPDKVVAQEAWGKHLLRNQSIIVDMLQGQLKSEVRCPDCSRHSVTFDPFMFLSVPMPEAESVMHDVKFVPPPNSEQPPRVVKVKLPKHATAAQMRVQLGKDLGIDPNELLLGEVWKNKLYARFKENQTVGSNGMEDLFAYHLPELKAEGKDNKFYFITLQIHHMTDKTHFKAFGFPLILPLEKELVHSYPQSKLRQVLRTALAPYMVDGWKDGEDDCATYLLDMMDQRANKCCDEVELTHEEKNLDLSGKVNHMIEPDDFSIGLFFKTDKKDRYLEYDFRSEPSASDAPKQVIKLGDCLDSYARKETLPESEAWYCSHCAKHQCADKQMTLWTLPDVLILHLKRFSYDRYLRDKITAYVDFPIQGLDMSPWLVNPEEKENAIYDLYAVSNHFGGLGGGHYTAYAQNLVNKKWYNLDDSSVSEVDPESVKTQAAYVLFYRRREPKNTVYKAEDYATGTE
eukprot:g80954.t1